MTHRYGELPPSYSYRRIILSMLILVPPELENLLAQVTVDRHADLGAAHGDRACALLRWPVWAMLADLAAGLGHALATLGRFRPIIVPLFLNFFSKLKSSRNSYNFLEFIENKLKLRKIRNKFI
jgi:hypothetical protein